MNTITLQLRYRAPAPLRLRLAQANALRLSCEWADADALPAAFDLVAEIHASRTVAPGSTPLAAQLVPNLTSASADPWAIDFSGAQLNHPIPNPPTRRLWMVVYLRTALAPVTVAAAEIELEYHAISGITPAPPTPAIYLTPEAAAEMFVSAEDFESLEGRVTALENEEGGGAALVQADWNAVSGPAQILNKPSLGNAASRNVGTGAGDVATGNHGHTTSQITGLDTALAGKAPSSHSHATSDVTGLDTALAGKAASSHTHPTSQISGLDAALAAKADLSGGKIPVSQIPSIAISEYLGSVASQSAMLALNGERGDYCTRSDLGKAFILIGEPSSLLVNWIEWVYPLSPVISVAGKTGAVTLSTGDLTDISAVGAALITALTVAAQRSALGLGALSTLSTVGTAQMDDAAVTNPKLASMAAGTVKGSVSGGTPADLTATQVTALLNTFTSSLKGLSTPSGGGIVNFQRADGNWTAPPGVPAGSGSELQFRNAGAFGAVTGSSVSGSVVTLAELRVNNGTTTTGLRVTADAAVTTLFLNGTGTDGFIYGGAGAGTNNVAVRGAAFRIEGSGASDALALLQIGSSGARLRTRGANNLTLGPADAASASLVAQTVSVQSATGTNQSASAAVFSIDGAQGTGTGAGGDVRIRVAPNGSTGASQNTLVEAVRFRATDLATVCAGAIIAGGPVVYASFTSSTLPSVTLWTRGQIWIAGDAGGPGVPAFSDGTNWRRYSDNSIVVPS